MTRACDSTANDSRICYEKYLRIWFLLQAPGWQTDSSKRLAIKAVLEKDTLPELLQNVAKDRGGPLVTQKSFQKKKQSPLFGTVVLAVPTQTVCLSLFQIGPLHCIICFYLIIIGCDRPM